MRDNRSSRWQPLLLLLSCVALVLLPLGCDDDVERTPAAPQVVEEVAPSGPIDALVTPAEVLAHGGSDDLAGLVGRLTSMAGPAGKAIDLSGLAPLLARHLALSDASALALDAPARFVMLDPAAHDEPLVLLLTIRSREQLLAALPADKRDSDGGNAYSYPGLTKKTVYLNFIDDFAVFTHEREQHAQLRPFLLALAGAQLGAEAAMVVSVAHALAIHSKRFEAALTQARQAIAGGAPGLPSSSGAGFSTMLESLLSLSKAVDRLTLRSHVRKDGAALAVDVHPMKGSDLATSLRLLGVKRKLDMLAKVPADAPLALAWSLDPDDDDELTRSLTAWSLQLTLGRELDETYSEAMRAYWKATTGHMAFAAHSLAGVEGLHFSALVGIRDAAAARKAQTRLRGMVQEPALIKLYQQMGMKLSYRPGAYRIGEVAVDTVSAELRPHAKATTEHDLRALGRTAALFTDMMNSHVAITDEMGFMTYGRDGRVTMVAWLGGKMPGGVEQTPSVVRALQESAPGTFMLLVVQPLVLLRAFGMAEGEGGMAEGEGGMAEGEGGMAESGPSASPDDGIAFSAGATDGVLHLVLDVPATQTVALLQALAADRGAPGRRP